MNNFESIEKSAAELTEFLKSKHKDNPTMLKKIAIVDNSFLMAKSVVELAQLCSKKKKKIFQPINRMPKGRIERKKKIFRKLVDIQSARMRHELIMQTPIPKFPKGSIEAAIVGELDKEVIKLNRL